MKNLEGLIVYNQFAGEGDAFEKALRVQRQIGGKIFDIRDLQAGNVGITAGKVIIIGGDGTHRKATLSFLSFGEYPEIGIIKSGTGNIFARTLEAEGFKSSLEEFVEGKANSAHYKPAVISSNGNGGEIFVVASGLGRFEKEYAKALDEKARKMRVGTETKLYVAGIEALRRSIKYLRPGESLLQTYSIGELVGPFKMFDPLKINVESPLIGLAQVKGENPIITANKLVLALVLLKAGVRHLPESILSVGYGDKFQATINETGKINIDGDVRQVAIGQVNLQRSRNGGFQITAIQL